MRVVLVSRHLKNSSQIEDSAHEHIPRWRDKQLISRRDGLATKTRIAELLRESRTDFVIIVLLKQENPHLVFNSKNHYTIKAVL